MNEQADPSSHPSHSRAFQNLVSSADDIVGLLAYALFKQNIAESVARGYASDPSSRDPGPSAVQLYRSAAEQMLGTFAADAVDQAREDIQQSAVLDRVNEAENDIKAHINSATSFRWSLFTSFVGWLLTLAVTVLVVLGLAVSGWSDALLDKLQASVRKPSETSAQSK